MAQDRERDVVVVGAGPAGATTATILAQKGYDVLMLDRDQFPRDKACGDGVPAGVFRRLYALGMSDKFDESIGRGEMYPITGMRLMSPKGHVIETPLQDDHGLHSHVAPRVYFDAVIQQHAIESGAEFQAAAVKEPLIEDDRVVGVKAQLNGSVEPIRSKIVVGADGVTSAITRKLRPKSNQHQDNHRAIALRSYIKGIDIHPNDVEFFLYYEILPGYAWIFPTGDSEANIGLGMRLDIFRDLHGDLNKMLDQFLELPQIKERLHPGYEIEKIRSWQLNFGSQKNLQHTFDGALLVGDAAGFINPVTGGGIHNAIISSELAAQTIEEAFAAGDTSRARLRIYEKRANDEMGSSMKRSYLIQRWLLKFPGLVDFLVNKSRTNKGILQIFLDKL
jgi:geranylgeranyl reductase family protein